MAEWISVKDRLPEDQEEVLVCTRSKNGARNIDKGYMAIDRFIHRGTAEVTHWMPLPGFPGERENDAPKLVRCKECRYGYDSGFKKNAVRCKFPPIGGYHPDEFFCAAGRRKEEEQNGE